MYRAMSFSVKVVRWDWQKGVAVDTTPIDITSFLKSVVWQKTLKSPRSSCTIQLLPQRSSFNVADELSGMDIIYVYEFNVCKFVGYIRRIGFTGAILSNGKPDRSGTLIVDAISNLLVDMQVGLNMGRLNSRAQAFLAGSEKLNKAISDASIDGLSFYELIQVVFTNFKNLLNEIGATTYSQFFDQFIDYSSKVSEVAIGAPKGPRGYSLYTGSELSMPFWQILQNLIESPFNELWFDSGPRYVNIDGTDQRMISEKCSLVFRNTPFNGYVSGGVSYNLFNDLPEKVIKKDYLKRFDLNKSVDEAYSVYSVTPAAFDLGDLTRALAGTLIVDEPALNKYLLKIYQSRLLYLRAASTNSTALDPKARKLSDDLDDKVKTLYNWFNLNDVFYSGALQINVPSDYRDDVYLGDKVALEQLEGHFYVEGVAHKWSYNNPLLSDISVTRGYNYVKNKKMLMSTKLFREGLSSSLKKDNT